MKRHQFTLLREAMEDGLCPEQVLEIFEMDTADLLDTFSNEDLLDYMDVIQDYLPDFDWEFTSEDME